MSDKEKVSIFMIIIGAIAAMLIGIFYGVHS